MTKQEFLRILEESIIADEGTVDADQPLNALEGWDSLGMLNLQMGLDDAGVAVPVEELRKAKTVADLMAAANAV